MYQDEPVVLYSIKIRQMTKWRENNSWKFKDLNNLFSSENLVLE